MIQPKRQFEIISEQIEGARFIARLVSLFSPKFPKQWKTLEHEYKRVQEIGIYMDHFIARYVPLGWTNYDRMSTDILEQLKDVGVDEGEEILTNFHLDQSILSLLRQRFLLPEFKAWQPLVDRAIERSGSKDWLSVIPLLLICIDGIFITITGKHPFSGGADIDIFDTFTSEPGGVKDGFKILGAVRRKLSVDPIDAPFRHGIMHGLNPEFGLPIVAAKAWNLLQAATDYIQMLRNEPKRLEEATKAQTPVAWRQILEKLEANKKHQAAIASWHPRAWLSEVRASNEDYSNLLSDTPERCAAEYLSALSDKNFGVVAKMTVDYMLRPVNMRAGRFRQDLGGLRIEHWKIVNVVDTAAAMTKIEAFLSVKVRGRSIDSKYEVRMLYADDEFDPMARGMTGGKWWVMPNLTTDLWVQTLAAS